MEWDVVISTALGTTGGTLISVLAAWGIYHFEKKDIRDRDRKNRIVETTINSIQLMSRSTTSVATANSLMLILKNVKVKEATINFSGDMVQTTAEVGKMLSELYIEIVTLEKIGGYSLLKDVSDYKESATEIMNNRIGNENFDYDATTKDINLLKEQSHKLIDELQCILKENINEK